MIEKQIVSYTPVECTIRGITLLSAEEYEEAQDYIQQLDSGWWLRSSDFWSPGAKLVTCDGSINEYGVEVSYGSVSVRPALLILKPESLNLAIGDKIRFAGYIWTIIPGDMALCDEEIGFNRFDAKTNDFKKSEIKQYIENWLADKLAANS